MNKMPSFDRSPAASDGPAATDPLSGVIALLQPRAAISKPITGRGRWGVRYAAHHAPGFTIILKGSCWISFAGKEPIRLRKGDFLLLPATPAFSLMSHKGVACELRVPTNTSVRHGLQEGEPDFASLGGSFEIEQVNASLLVPLLPSLIRIPASAGRAKRLRQLIGLIMEECGREDPGKEIVLRRLLDVLMVEALRRLGPNVDFVRGGLLRGLHDPALARVLRTIHADVRSGWTVAGLAKIAGLSRSAFAVRFRESLGCGPIEYLARWRMALARDALSRGTKSLDAIADEIGYESASAFSTSFRKRVGCSPSKFARARGGAGTLTMVLDFRNLDS